MKIQQKLKPEKTYYKIQIKSNIYTIKMQFASLKKKTDDPSTTATKKAPNHFFTNSSWSLLNSTSQ
jgi:hypothetical protein